jgi:hypothetical protein
MVGVLCSELFPFEHTHGEYTTTAAYRRGIFHYRRRRRVIYGLVCDIANSVEIDFICVYKREEISHDS